MITTHEQMHQSLEQIGRLYRALAALRDEVLPSNPRNYAVLAEGPLDQIRAIEEEVQQYVGAAEAEANSAPLWLHVESRKVDLYEPPVSILSGLLEKLRKGILAITEFRLQGELAAKPIGVIGRACDLRLVALQPGSLRLAIRPPHTNEFSDDESEDFLENEVKRSIFEYVQVASWAASGDDASSLERYLPNAEMRRLVLTELARLLPTSRGAIDYVEISGEFAQGKLIRLVRETRKKIEQALDESEEQQVETHIGFVREIDLDKLSFMLRNIGEIEQIACEFKSELLESAKEALDKKVEVTGTRKIEEAKRRGYAPLIVTRLEIFEIEDEEAEEEI